VSDEQDESEQEMSEMPTAAKVGNPEGKDGKPAYVSEKVELSKFAGWSDVEEGDKLVRLVDAEERERAAERRGREQERKRILEKMTEIAQDNWGGKHEATKYDWKNAWQTLCKELRGETTE